MLSNDSKLYVCNSCLYHTYKEQILVQHKKVCAKIIADMPPEDEAILEYNGYHREIDVPFVIYANFEYLLLDDDTPIDADSVTISSSSSSFCTKKRIPCAFSFNIKCNFDINFDKLISYVGDGTENVGKVFIDRLKDEVRELLKNHYTRSRKKSYLELTAHNTRNLLFGIPKFIPIYFHDFPGYNCHPFIEALIESDPQEVEVLPLNNEFYTLLSQSIDIEGGYSIELRFLDTNKFMPGSLDKLSTTLSDEQLNCLSSYFQNKDEFSLMREKFVFPHEYLDTFSKLSDSKLPSLNDFFSLFYNEKCALEDYQHAEKVWNILKCKTLKDYLKLFVITNVLLLSDIFENYRKVCKNVHKLDPSQYVTATELTWDVMLKTTNVKLDLFTDLNMYNLLKMHSRRGIRLCQNIYTKANNKYVSDYDPTKPSEYLWHLKANNLYNWAMSQYLPQGDFQWVENFDHLWDVKQIPDDSPIGYIYVVDLIYPHNIHDSHRDLPFCAANKKVEDSEYNKLITDLTDKEYYPIHYRLLKQCLKHGLVLKKIHQILAFKQSPWLKEYIDLNTYHTTLANNSFEKDFFQLSNNFIYDKIMENVDDRKTVHIVSHNKLGASNLIDKPYFHSISHMSEEILAIHMNPTRLKHLKPIYLDFCLLELSKWKMYQFHYEYMKPKYKSNVTLNYMDKDMLIYSIKTEDLYKDIKSDIADHFDTSDYAINNKYDIPCLNKNVSGMMKDERNGKIMREFIGIGPNMFSISIGGDSEMGNSNGVHTTISSDSYNQCCQNHTKTCQNMLTFTSQLRSNHMDRLKQIFVSQRGSQ